MVKMILLIGGLLNDLNNGNKQKRLTAVIRCDRCVGGSRRATKVDVADSKKKILFKPTILLASFPML